MNAPENTDGRHCPFNKELCRGICIYANILENISLGLVLFDTKEKTVVFQNKTAIDMFEAISPKEYGTLSAILFPEGMDDIHVKNAPSQKTLRYGGRLLGYSVYTVSNRYLKFPVFLGGLADRGVISPKS